MPRRQTLIEIVLVFAVFALQGGWPVPDVNEPYYVGKAIHYWNPAWAPSDFFLNSADTHAVFYLTFGWLSLLLSQTALTWTLRLLTWALLAWSWRRLSVAVVPRRWFSVLTAIFFAMLLQHGNMAGEWVIGGVEAKGFAYVFVFLGMEALVRGQWNRTWLAMGIASAFHVLVGFWAAVTAGLAWLSLRWKTTRESAATPGLRVPVPTLRKMLPALVVGFVLSLPGLIPSLVLNWGKDAETVHQAHRIYVYQRLPHHLDPLRFAFADHVLPMLVLCGVWWLLWRKTADDGETQRLGRMVNAAIVVAIAGFAIRLLDVLDLDVAVGLLRFYWFRLLDVVAPLGVALFGLRWVARRPSRIALAVVVLLAAFHVGDCLVLRLFGQPPYSERVPSAAAWASAGRWITGRGEGPKLPRPRADRLPNDPAWREACAWIAESGRIPPDARFFVPRMSQTFKWYTHRGIVVSWKEIPQDARGLVDWQRRIEDVYETHFDAPLPRWYDSPTELHPDRLRRMAERYQADYAIGSLPKQPTPFPIVFQNQAYVIYQLRPESSKPKP